ncbi:MAG: 16S rRNA (cytidine(1402)-2'-O)-methyltransferase [Candidatus Omnitrophota bacterium]|nr:MAG: 16S rRNA (cytidine(1402)-2'-O)-methyltransferase [Candidatus Omnitrophota bacterium]
MQTTGALYIVSTPIGNLEDITLRALRTLKEVDLIAAEDTRHTKILLDKYNIRKKLISFYSYNRLKRKDEIIGLLKEGRNIALVSDAGTPGISDPGFSLIKSAIESRLPLTPIPGPTALITALVISGKPTDKFVFEGFLSNKSSKRRRRLEFLKDEERAIIIYESCHRITKLLKDISDIMGDREIVLTRELTKKFEEVKRERVSALLEYFSGVRPRGEFIVVI